jgi:hypothetical protein
MKQRKPWTLHEVALLAIVITGLVVLLIMAANK